MTTKICHNLVLEGSMQVANVTNRLHVFANYAIHVEHLGQIIASEMIPKQLI